MSVLNENINSFKAIVRKSHFTKNQEHKDEFLDVYVFGIQSCAGRILTFHVMTDDGMVRSRVPLSEIFMIFHSTINNSGIVFRIMLR
jgi:hypothetical protein